MRIATALFLLPLVLARTAAAEPVADVEPPSVTPPTWLPRNAAGAVIAEVHLIDDSEIFDPIIRWRVPGETDYHQAKLTRARATLFRTEVAVPGSASAFEYYIEVFDSNGNGPARLGDKMRPILVPLAPGTPAVATAEPAKAADPAKAAAPTPEKKAEKKPEKQAEKVEVPKGALEPTEPGPSGGGAPWKWVALGAAVVAAGAGGYLGYGVMNQANALEGVPAAEFGAQRAAIESGATAATGAWVAAGVLAATSAVLFVAF